MPNSRTRLLELLHERAFLEGAFTLSSGKQSDRYFDAKQATLSPDGMVLGSELIHEVLKKHTVDAIGGLTMGSDPIAVAYATWAKVVHGQDTPVLAVRKTQKAHGLSKWVEGPVRHGCRVAVVDDVVTSGDSVLTAIERLENEGCQIEVVIALVDREEGAKEKIQNAGYRFESVFKNSEIAPAGIFRTPTKRVASIWKPRRVSLESSLMPKKPRLTLDEQRKLLGKAERSGDPLAKVLAAAGWTYDDLLYEDSGSKAWKGGNPLTLTDVQSDRHEVPVVSFFTGCGGMDLGFEAAGFKHVAAFEINELSCKTLRTNRQDWKVFGPPTHIGDVSDFGTVTQLLAKIAPAPFDGVFIGGPPCQPFSIAANQRFAKSGDDFKRIGFAHTKNGNLLFDYLDLVIEFKPAVFVVENVPGLRDLDGGVQLRSAIERLRGAGYKVAEPFVVDAANFGVPQHRQRLFVIGSRADRAFAALDVREKPVGAGSVLNGPPKAPNNETREHKVDSIRRYMALGYGQRDHLGRVDRLDPTLPSKTVIAGGTNGGGRSHLHPEVPRTLSVRECARLQTFPDDYEFVGAPARQFTQVGNAVPPVLAAQLGRKLKESFF